MLKGDWITTGAREKRSSTKKMHASFIRIPIRAVVPHQELIDHVD